MSTAASLTASGAGLAGGFFAADAARSEGIYQQQAYEENAKLLNLQAEDAQKRGDEEAKAHQLKVRGLVGAQRASAAAQGIDVGSGSAAHIQEETFKLGYDDTLRIRNNAFREAWGLQSQAIDIKYKGAFARIAAANAGANALASSGLKALSTAADAMGSVKQPNDTSSNMKVNEFGSYEFGQFSKKVEDPWKSFFASGSK